ncbi:phosphoenolpyruvate hydrolase family protein, partial [Enterococcus faecalis]|uniref:phosphoenolpyruvate hydrolase family protein n=2 Tax=Lactobacillales TaxID=186826 RepID=UPI00254ACEA4
MTQSREALLKQFKQQVEEGHVLLGVGAGTGITAKSSEAGGADLLIIYNSGRYRMAGRGSLAGLLAYGDANAIVQEMGHEVL